MSFKILAFLTLSIISVVVLSSDKTKTYDNKPFAQETTEETATGPTGLVEATPVSADLPLPTLTTKLAIGTKSVTRLDIPENEVVYIKGPIMGNAASIVEELKSKAKHANKLWLLIDSPGGSVVDGAAIVSAMEASTVKVNTVCLQLCASMAFIIHQYGTKRYAVDRSILMAHPASGGVQGTIGQMHARLDVITRYVDKLDLLISKRVNLPFGDFRSLIVSEFWVDAEDALKAHYVDGLVDIRTDARAPVPQVMDFSKSENDGVFWKNGINLIWMQYMVKEILGLVLSFILMICAMVLGFELMFKYLTGIFYY